MINLKLDRSSELAFKLNIEGNATQSPPRSRFIIEMTDQFKLVLQGRVVDENQVKVTIPPLSQFKEIFKGEIVKCSLEVMVDENYFVPWESSAKITIPIAVQAESVSQEVLEEEEHKVTQISISLEGVTETEDDASFAKDHRTDREILEDMLDDEKPKRVEDFSDVAHRKAKGLLNA